MPRGAEPEPAPDDDIGRDDEAPHQQARDIPQEPHEHRVDEVDRHADQQHAGGAQHRNGIVPKALLTAPPQLVNKPEADEIAEATDAQPAQQAVNSTHQGMVICARPQPG